MEFFEAVWQQIQLWTGVGLIGLLGVVWLFIVAVARTFRRKFSSLLIGISAGDLIEYVSAFSDKEQKKRAVQAYRHHRVLWNMRVDDPAMQVRRRWYIFRAPVAHGAHIDENGDETGGLNAVFRRRDRQRVHKGAVIHIQGFIADINASVELDGCTFMKDAS